MAKVVRAGDLVNFADGQIVAVILETDEHSIKVQFKHAGYITEHSPMRIIGQRLSALPVLTEQDVRDIEEIAIHHKFDYISVPGISSARDLQDIRMKFRDDNKLGILAKIDNLEAVHQFNGVIKYAEGVILVRNELAFELPAEKLIVAQKWMT